VLPTHLSASPLSVADLYGSITGFIAFYSALLVVELYLMAKYARLGPHEEPAATAPGGASLRPVPAAPAGEGA